MHTDITHPSLCHCEACQADLRVAAAMEHADRYYQAQRRRIALIREAMEPCVVMRFPAERTHARGEL
jgi:hypothetical protein